MNKMQVNRRVFEWNRIKTPLNAVGVLISTGFGAGLFPFAPGTIGALVGIPFASLLSGHSIGVRVIFWCFMFLLGTWAASVMDEMMQTEDNQNIVFDEVVGLGVSAIFVADQPLFLFLAFLLFRFFDVLKIFPVNQLDNWSKKQTKPLLRGFGVMADDLLAGIQACIVLIIIHFFSS